jgi:hypothetical protein
VLPRKIGTVEIVRDVTKDEMLAAAQWMIALMQAESTKTLKKTAKRKKRA